MEFKQSLSQRIIIAFALMSALVAGTFAMGIVATVHLVEEKLISAGLGGDLQRLLLMDNVRRVEPSSRAGSAVLFQWRAWRFRLAQGPASPGAGLSRGISRSAVVSRHGGSGRRAALRPAARPE
jgi:hypothetical protein